MLKIYGVPISVHTRKVIVAALEKKLKYDNEPVIPFTPPTGWDSLSPTGKIPAIDDDGFRLADSAVINAYLERKHPKDPLYPKDTRDYGRALWFEQYASVLFRDVIHGLFFQKVIRPAFLKEETDADEIDRILLDAMPKTFAYLESQVNGEYLVGDRFGIADIAVTSNLINYNYLGLRIDQNRYPKLSAYFKTQLGRASFAAALAAERPFAGNMGLDQFAAELARA